MTPAVSPECAAALADRAGLGPVAEVRPLVGGKNNRVFALHARDGVGLLKAYFRHPNDPRDRLRAEWSFTNFAWSHGVTAGPRPLACDPDAGLGLYEFLPGRKLAPGEVTVSAVAQAVSFFAAVNRHRAEPDAATLPEASEVAFTLGGHCELIRKRVERLLTIPADTPAERDAARFVRGHLLPAWERVEAGVRRAAGSDTPLSPAGRCVSPSDFGFHNALVADDGRVRFVDFEYAGWDDPARTACDFFCQPAVLVPDAMFRNFVGLVAESFPDPGRVRRRAELLLPVYRLKWCCIVLNDFLPVGSRRREFSGNEPVEDRKVGQLAKAERMLERAA